jgi:hypothetical protein
MLIVRVGIVAMRLLLTFGLIGLILQLRDLVRGLVFTGSAREFLILLNAFPRADRLVVEMRIPEEDVPALGVFRGADLLKVHHRELVELSAAMREEMGRVREARMRAR